MLNFSDSVDDVWLFQGDVTTLTTNALTEYSWNQVDWTQGDFAETIDIVSATVDGQSVTIECQGEIPVSTPLGNFTRPATVTTPMTPPTSLSNFTRPARTSIDLSMYSIYFDDDDDATEWEAAIIYTAGGGRGGGGTYYYIGDLTTMLIPMGQFGGDTTGWTLDSEGNHHSISENALTFSFPEYTNIVTAKIMVVTMQMQMVVGFPPQIEDWYWDWAPDDFEFWESETTSEVPEFWLELILTAILLLGIPLGVLLRVKKW
jgi:hypothetical protein